jgi:hypothetical protein
MAGPTAEFQTNIDVANTALQFLGQPRIVTFADDAKGAAEIAFCYDKLRRAELQRNIWRFAVRTVALRAIDPTVLMLDPAAWNIADTYLLGSIVSYNGQTWQALQPVPAGQEPDTTGAYWDVYSGSMNVTQWLDPTQSTNTTVVGGYYAGELVYVLTGTSVAVYLSLINGNQVSPATIPAWSATTTYNKNDTVTLAAVTYQSLIDLNLNNSPPGAQWQAIPGTQPQSMVGQSWMKLDATLQSMRFAYPIGAGPGTQSTTRNAFMLPNGYLKEAPQDPKAGLLSFLGAPSNSAATDWVFQGNYITSSDAPVIILRFAADTVSIPNMTEMFMQGLAARIAMQVCEQLTQSTQKLNGIASQYKVFMSEARVSNAIENGSDEPPLDDWIACRV